MILSLIIGVWSGGLSWSSTNDMYIVRVSSALSYRTGTKDLSNPNF